MTIFGIKMMVKSGLEKIFWNSTSPFSVAAAQCKKNLPRNAELAWLVSRYLIGSWRLKIEQISVYCSAWCHLLMSNLPGDIQCVPWLQNLIFWSSLEAEDCGSKPVHITKARKLEFCSKIQRKQTNREIKSLLIPFIKCWKKYKKYLC